VAANTLTLNGSVSVTSGAFTSQATGTVSYNQSTGGQNVLAGTYGNLTFSAQSKLLASSGTIAIAGTFTPAGSGHTITGSTVDFSGTGAQSIPAFSYNNLTISGKTCARLYSPGSGDESWYESFPEAAAPEKTAGQAARGPGDIAKRESRRKILRHSEPSRQESYERKASAFFNPETRDVLDFGSAIHELFEKIEWLDAGVDAEAIIKAWLPSRPCDQTVKNDVLKQFRTCLESAGVREALARPAGNVELWREKSFEIIMDGQWISDVFDRVVVTRGDDGAPRGGVRAPARGRPGFHARGQ